MSTAAYLDCVLGVAGDMLLGALVAAGADQDIVIAAVASLGIDGVSVRFEPARRAGFACTRALVTVPGQPDAHRSLADVLGLIAGKVGLLIEVKSPGRDAGPLCAAVKRDLAAYPGPVGVMSFNPRIGRWFAAHAFRRVRWATSR